MGHLSRVLSLDGFKMNKIVVVHVAHPGFLGFLILGEKNEKYRFTSVLDCIFASGIHRENAYFHGNFEQNKSKCYFNHVIERSIVGWASEWSENVIILVFVLCC